MAVGETRLQSEELTLSIHSTGLGHDEWARKDRVASNMPPIWVRPAVACKLAGVGLTKLYELIADGDLVSRKVGGARLISVASIESLGDA